jgi:hypothetical protein
LPGHRPAGWPCALGGALHTVGVITMNCASCGAAVHPAADFCRVCGADAPVSTKEAAPRLRGMDALRAIRIPGALSIHLPNIAVRLPRGGGSVSAPSSRTSALHLGAPTLPAAIVLPRISSRGAMIAGAALVGIVFALLAIRVTLGAGDSDATARELDAARVAITQRDAKIASLEGTVATGSQAQSALQSTAQSAQSDNAALKNERDQAKQRVALLETKLMQTEGSLTDLQKVSAKQAQDIKTLTTCLNGTAVGLAFGRTNRWTSADFALAAVVDACKASESLLQR